MNRNLAIALIVAAAAAGNAFADDITVDTTPFVSSKTRAEVQSELAQYKRSGVDVWSNQYDPLAHFSSTLTRTQVKNQYIALRGEVTAFTGEDSGSAYITSHGRSQTDSTRVAGQTRNAQ